MGPLILARAGVRFAAKVHGSALSYTVIPNPRFLPHAREGMEAAEAVLVGSRHTAESLWETVDVAASGRRRASGPPGSTSRPSRRCRAGRDPRAELEALAAAVEGAGEGDEFGRVAADAVPALHAYAGAEGRA